LIEKQTEYLNRKKQLEREQEYLDTIKKQSATKVFNWSTMQYEYTNGFIPEEEPALPSFDMMYSSLRNKSPQTRPITGPTI
jgi:hypothetical protein